MGAALHEVSNGLTVILGWLERARQLSNDPQSREAVEVALGRARRAHRIARKAIGAEVERAAAEPLRAIVDECIVGLTHEASRAGVGLVVDLDTKQGALPVEAGDRLLQVLTNLVMNALAATPAGGLVRIEHAEGAESDLTTLRVVDGGPGVPPADRERLFERGTTGRVGGAGIGLSHSLRVVAEEGGKLSLAPYREGSGAVFELSWSTAPVTSRKAPRTVRAASLDGIRVAVLDDDASIVELLDMVLSARGAHVTAFSTQEALSRALSEQPYDVALLDASPYGADLKGSLGELKRRHPDTDLVLISGTTDPGVNVGQLGVTWIRKPFDVEEVIDVVRLVRGSSRADS